jgi:hypothetical protein
MWRDIGSSVSSQCMSTIRPRSAAISQSRANGAGAVVHGALEMRNAADDVDAHVERFQKVLLRTRRAEQPVLRKGDKLQVDVVLDLLAHFQQTLDPGQLVVADVDMGPDRQAALGRPRGRSISAPARPPRRRSGSPSVRPRARCPPAACRSGSCAAGRGRASRPCGSGCRRRAATPAWPFASITLPASAVMPASTASIRPPLAGDVHMRCGHRAGWRF